MAPVHAEVVLSLGRSFRCPQCQTALFYIFPAIIVAGMLLALAGLGRIEREMETHSVEHGVLK
jgi:hypothetical protein